jgi:hypothetical protein
MFNFIKKFNPRATFDPSYIKLGGWKPDPANKMYRAFDKAKLELSPNKIQYKSQDDIDLKPYTSARHDQRSTSSCVGQGVIKALEIKRIVQHGHANHVDLSVLDVYYGARERMTPSMVEWDSGTYISLACDVLRDLGVCREIMHPFNVRDVYKKPSVMASREARLNRIKSHFKIKNYGQNRLDDIIFNLKASNPVVFGTTVGTDWMRYRGGSNPLRVETQPKGGHAMVILGFVDGLFIIENSWGCYDDQTEVLTNSGWKNFSEISYKDEFATLNPETHTLEYQKASQIHEYDFDGELHQFNSQGVDLAVTPNHRMYVTNYRRKDTTLWQIERADEISGRVCFKKDAMNITPDIESFTINDQDISADIWLEFMGYFISEGSTTYMDRIRTRSRVRPYTAIGGTVRCGTTGKFIENTEPNPEIRISEYAESYSEKYYNTSLSQTIGPKAEKIASCIAKLPFRFTEHNRSPENRKDIKSWTCQTKNVYEYLSRLGKAHNKYIPRDLLRLSKRQSQILLDALMLGDGTRSGGKYTYYTSSKRLADDVQELALRCGLAADISVTDRVNSGNYKYPEYRVGIKTTRTRPESEHNPSTTKYTGKVRCATVPNGLLYVRRNGKAVWCGNSAWGDNGFGFVAPEVFTHPSTQDLWVMVDGSEAWTEK